MQETHVHDDLPQHLSMTASREDRTQFRAEHWLGVIREAGLSPESSILEIGPGESEKIGRALQMHNFRGTVYILEPSSLLGPRIADRYREILPHAEVRLLSLTVRELIEKKDMPHIDAVLSNHPLDDLILGEVVQKNEWDAVWGDTYSDPDAAMAQIRNKWRTLEDEPAFLLRVKDRVVSDLVALFSGINPSLFVIYQYPSTTLQIAGFEKPDQCAQEVMQNLREVLSVKEGSWNGVFRRMDLDPSSWLVIEKRGSLREEMMAPPDALHRLGAEIFLPIPALIQHGADRSFLGLDPESSETDDALADICTIDLATEDQSTPNTTVYVDRQSDPTGIALGDHLGSGRAGYVGRRFNIKGVGRTPYVRADPSSVHGTGRMNLFKSAWEMIAANTVSNAMSNGGSTVAALGDLKRTFPLKGKDWMAVSVLRVDNGALDRPTHLLNPESMLIPFDLSQMARDFGRLDAEQFTERILHNAWSAGNISIAGQLIDFDTASGVRYRCPHYSYNAKYRAVLFGLEGEGKKMVLNTLIDHHPSAKSESRENVEQEFEMSRARYMRLRMLKLFGLTQEDLLQVNHRLDELITPMAALFQTYAPKMYPNFQALDLMRREASPALFDFSKLFRCLPLLRESGSMELEEEGMSLLVNKGSLEPGPVGKIQCHELLLEKVVIGSEQELSRSVAAGKIFVSLFCKFLDALETLELSSDARMRALRAYTANEDRGYMQIGEMMPFLTSLDAGVLEGKTAPSQVRELLSAIVKANDRRIIADRNGELSVDTKIFHEGALCTIIRSDGLLQEQFDLFPNPEVIRRIGEPDALSVESQNEDRSLVKLSGQTTVYRSAPYPVCELISRGIDTGRKPIHITSGGKAINVHSILEGMHDEA